MTYDDAIRTVLASSADDWHVIHCGGGHNGGPSYLDEHGGEYVNSHYARAVWKADIALGLAWGLSYPDDHRSFDWALRFSDGDAYPQFVEILWNGMLIHRQWGAVVDGGRATLPWPRMEYVESGSPFDIEHICDSTTATGVGLWRLVAELNHNREFERYLERSGLVIVPDEEPGGE